MPGNIKIEVRGIEELKRELARLSTATAQRLSGNAAMAGARVVARHARALAPVETGELRDSIKARRPRGGQAAGQRTAFAGTKVFYGRFAEFGTQHQPARPFIRPAADQHAAEVRRKIEENLSRGIDRTIAKQTPPADPGEDLSGV